VHPKAKSLIMTTIKHLSIPKPCSQNWEQMSPGDNGRYCGHCAKTVVDFTQMPTDGILKIIAGQGHSCGRFNQFQIDNLNDKLNQSEKTVSFWRKGLAAASLVGILSFVKAETKPLLYGMEQVPVQHKSSKMTLKVDSAFTMTVSGTVVASDDKLPIPGATISVKGTNIMTRTDANGRFKLTVSGTAQILMIKEIGFLTKEFTILNDANPDVHISMEISPLILGEVVGGVIIIRQPFFKRIYYRFIKRPFRKLFH
jgi:hypothetical protein